MFCGLQYWLFPMKSLIFLFIHSSLPTSLSLSLSLSLSSLKVMIKVTTKARARACGCRAAAASRGWTHHLINCFCFQLLWSVFINYETSLANHTPTLFFVLWVSGHWGWELTLSLSLSLSMHAQPHCFLCSYEQINKTIIIFKFHFTWQ